MDELVEMFGDAVRSARIGRGLTQEDLAAAVRTHRTTINGIERGSNSPRLPLTLRLIAVLDLDVGAIAQQALSDVRRVIRHATEAEWHNYDCGILGGFPHAASAHDDIPRDADVGGGLEGW